LTARRDPFARPVDRMLAGLRQLAAEYELTEPVYRLLAGIDDEGDAWMAVCPSHPISGYSLLIVDRGDDVTPTLRCRFGCWPAGIERILVPDPDRERQVAAMVKVLLWASSWPARRAAA
jgi:hypothetical protein